MSARRPLLLPFVPLYRAGVRLRNRAHDRNAPRTLAFPVVSIGSIAAGGAGKTPFLAAFARLLQGEGYAPDVLSRGYGRHTHGILRVDPDGIAGDFGDEPLLLARTLGVPVYVGSSRHAAGALAEAEQSGANRVHLLDDGFSHRDLARTLDIALLTTEDARDTLLPAGNLREPLDNLARADVLVVRSNEAHEMADLARSLAGETKPVWTITRRLSLPPNLPGRPVVFSAIARPADFEADLRASGIGPLATHRFRDHHALTTAEMAMLLRSARTTHADGFITTAKDAVKLTPSMLQALQELGPVTVADMTVDFQDPAAVLRDVCQAFERTHGAGG